ncbi:hypothetical protein [Halostella sp. PRR32]|uniref:hypothetical protein n=1 Tax=Halostella sp. PRR32 TaxID=3098147 RepID=UPI002B1E62BE|nr:hypothetical protein [Halostella sp. PRR32]
MTDLTRRQLMRRSAAAAGGLTIAGSAASRMPRLSPVGRADAAVGLAIATGAGVVAGAALTHYVWDDGSAVDEEQYQEKVAEEVHNGLMQDATRIKGEQENFFNQTNNVTDLTESAATQDAQTAAVEEILNGSDRATVVQAASDAVSEYYATNQKNFLLHWDKIITDIHVMLKSVDSTDALSFGQVFDMRTDYGNGDPETYKGGTNAVNYDLLDGTTYTSESPVVGISGGANHWFDMRMTGHGGNATVKQVYIKPPDSGGSQQLMVDIANDYHGLWSDLKNKHNNAVSQAETVAGELFDGWKSGMIDQSQLVSASDFASMGQNSDNFAQANSTLASLGVPVSEPAVVIETEVPIEDQTTTDKTTTETKTETRRYEGVLAMRSPPSGGLPVGSPIDPDALPGPVFFSYNRENWDGEIVGAQTVLQDQFTIVQREGSGDTVSFNEPVDRVTESGLSAEEYAESMKSYNEAETRARSRQTEIIANSGGGGGFLSDLPLRNIAIAGGIAILGAFGLNAASN